MNQSRFLVGMVGAVAPTRINLTCPCGEYLTVRVHARGRTETTLRPTAR